MTTRYAAGFRSIGRPSSPQPDQARPPVGPPPTPGPSHRMADRLARLLPAWTMPWLSRLSLFLRAIVQAHDRQAQEAVRQSRLTKKGSPHV